MPGSPVLAELNIRVVDSNTGTEIISELPHLHQSTWRVRGLQPGATGSAQLGSFTIPLHAPRSNEGHAAKRLYDLLDKGQRIEAYLSGSGGSVPYQTGVITAPFDRTFGPWVINGQDSLWWLQQSQLFPGEQVGPSTGPSRLVQLFGSTREVVYDSYANALTTVSGTINNVTADPQFGLPGISAAGTAIAMNQFGGGWNANQQYNLPTHPSDAYASALTVWGTIFSDTNTTNAGAVGIFFLADLTGANGYLCEVFTAYSGSASTGYNVGVRLWSETAGVFTQLSQGTVFTGLQSNTFPYELTCVLFNNNNTGYNFHIVLNGKDTGVGYQTTSLLRSSGFIGVRFSEPGAFTQYINRLRFESRTGQYGSGTWGTNRFQAGTVTNTTAVIPFITSQNQTHLDIIQLAMALDGFVCKKAPGRGYKGDVLTYGLLGADLSAQVKFVEGENVIEQGTGVFALADLFSNVTRYSTVPGGNSGGTIEWSPIANVGDMALIDIVTDVGAPDSSLQMASAIQVAARKSNPLQAYQVGIVRTSDVAEQFGVYDYVQVDLPTLRIYKQKLQVIGWDFKERQGDMPVFLNQFPMQHSKQQPLQRVSRAMEWLTQHSV